MRRLAETFDAQPPWSEIPLMIFVAQPEMDRAARSFEALGPRAHVTLVDRPIHVKTLLSSVRTSLRSRLRQYDIRDLLAEQQKLLEKERASALRLSGLAEASLAIASALSLDDVLQMITDQAAKVINSRIRVDLAESEGEHARRGRSWRCRAARTGRATASTSAPSRRSMRSQRRSAARSG